MHSPNDAGNSRRGHSRMQYIDNINTSTREYWEENTRVTDDRG